MSYKNVALKAAELSGDKKIDPLEAWERCVKSEYPNSLESQNKGCPKSAFLGLCEEGKIKNIPSGKYTTSTLNKRYALNAIKILASSKNKILASSELWKEVLKQEADKSKRHNCQMDVVIALWEAGLINFEHK